MELAEYLFENRNRLGLCFCLDCMGPFHLCSVDINECNVQGLLYSEILHIEYQIVCCIETYLIHIYHMSKCSKCNWNRYIEGFCMWNVHLHTNGLSPNIAYVILMNWPLMAIYFLLLNYWLFSVQFSYQIKISKHYLVNKYYEWILKKNK